MATTSSEGRRELASVAVAIALTAALGGCVSHDQVVLVRVEGTTSGSIAQLAVHAQVGDDEVRDFGLTGAKGAISLPTTFTLQIPTRLKGEFKVQVWASDDKGLRIGFGAASSPVVPSAINVPVSAIHPIEPDAGAKPQQDAAAVTDAKPRLDAHMERDGAVVDTSNPPDAVSEADVAQPEDTDALDAGNPDAATIEAEAASQSVSEPQAL